MNKHPKDLVLAEWKHRRKKQRLTIYRLSAALFLIWYLFCLPSDLFQNSTSTVLLDKDGQLLGARIAKDGQWRFEQSDSVPYKFAQCIIQFEDRNFYTHPGISAKGILRAIVQNARNKKRVSGGSTITMQLIRIMKKNPPRTYSEKIYEMILATRAEMSYTKEEILGMYAANAPFGNNVVGLDAAAWRYYGRPSYRLSWAECATLAVLPNAPGLIYPGRNQEKLLAKRNRLLTRLHEIGLIDQTTYDLSLSEPLPGKPLPLPQHAQHLMDHMILKGKEGRTIQTSISLNLQERTKRLLQIHSQVLRDNKIFNGAVIVSSVKTGEVLAYVGNTEVKDEEYSAFVDCANAPRSSGSILKPLLYAASLDEGLITPEMLVTDVPSQFGSFSPKNFSGQFEGAIPVNKALSRSLNVPMVHLLNDYGVSKFHKLLKQLGFSTLHQPARHYGLSLILGGAETKLTDLSRVYTGMAQKLNGQDPNYELFDELDEKDQSSITLSRGAIFSTFEAMVEVNRPDEDNNWRIFSSSRKIAWKTGTSFGFRDAWAVGVTPDYVVAVWIGNADGEGRPGLTGVKAAAPLMFDVFRQLPNSKNWFTLPMADMKVENVCRQSGYKEGKYCTRVAPTFLPKSERSAKVCTYHQLIHLDKTGTYRVDSDCEEVFNMQHKIWFVLPSLMEHYYRLNHPDYVVLPPYSPKCLSEDRSGSFTVVYPKRNSKIYVPREIDGTKGRSIFEVAHRHNGIRVFWHLDDQYIGESMEIHQMAMNPSVGKHVLTVIDEKGVSQRIPFEVIK